MENTTETKEIVGTIGYDPFVLRQFKPDFKGTNLSRIDQTKLLDLINVNYQKFLTTKEDAKEKPAILLDSDWDFCKYLVFANPATEIKSQVAKIDLTIYPYIRSGYSSRTPEELPILSRWAELPPGFSQPAAKYVVCVLYTREQLLAEHDKKILPEGEERQPFYLPEDVKYGIVAIMGTITPEADPMIPVTMMRNSLGMEEGGNGAKLNKDAYKKSVQFWETHIMIK